MKFIIAGSRTIKDCCYLINGIDYYGLGEKISEVVCGGAKGVDYLGGIWAINNNKPLKKFIPDWDTYGKSAGPIRNEKMAEYSDCLLLIWDGKSKGSKNMKECMEKLGKPVYEILVLD